jgi:hypothetical protein
MARAAVQAQAALVETYIQQRRSGWRRLLLIMELVVAVLVVAVCCLAPLLLIARDERKTQKPRDEHPHGDGNK